MPGKAKTDETPQITTLENLTPEQKKALALQLLGESDPGALEAVNLHDTGVEDEKKVEQAFASEMAKQMAQPHVWIEINRMGPEDKEGGVFIGAAGVDRWIPKETKWPVPRCVIDVLNNAVIEGFVPIVDEVRGIKWLKPVKYKRFPFSYLGPASPKEVEDFRKEQARKRAAMEQGVLGREAVAAALQNDSLGAQPEEENFIPAYMKQEITEVP